MKIEDYQEVIANYQQKCFELLNESIVLKSQVNSLNKTVEGLTAQINSMNKTIETLKEGK